MNEEIFTVKNGFKFGVGASLGYMFVKTLNEVFNRLAGPKLNEMIDNAKNSQ